MLSKDITDITQNNDISTFFFPPSEGVLTVSKDYTFITNGEPIVKTFDNVIIEGGCTVSTSNMCKGLYLNILGDCTIEGILSMTGKGIGNESSYVGIDTKYGIFYSNNKNTLINELSIPDTNIIPKIGPRPGESITNRCTGAGGSGTGSYAAGR